MIYKMYLKIIVPFLLIISGSLSEEDLLSELECEVDPLGYLVPDPTFCDRYLICEPNGEKRIVVCESGQNFNFDTTNCAPKEVVNCGDRSRSWRSRENRNLSRRPLRILGANDHADADVQRQREESSNPTEEVLSSIFSGRDPVLAMLKSRTNPSSTTSTTLSTSTTAAASSKSSKLTVRVPDDPLADVHCEDGEAYVVPDPNHCDRFLSCPQGDIEICDEGLVLDSVTGFCLLRTLVRCGERELNFRDNQAELERRLAQRIRSLKQASRARAGNIVSGPMRKQVEDSKPKAAPSKSPVADHDRVQETLGFLINQARRSQGLRWPVGDVQRDEADHHHVEEQHEDHDEESTTKISDEDMEKLIQEIRDQILREYNLLKRK